MKNKILDSILHEKRGSEYDAVVMYSGGKDSSYLLYLLKEVYKLRVKAVIVDNGFEHENIWKHIRKFAEKMEVPFEVIRQDKEAFRKLFKVLIAEHDLFKKENTNHVCFICNNFLWCSVAKYASDNGIPYVVSGLSLAQLSSGRAYPLKPDKMANSIAEKSTKMILKNALSGMHKSSLYNEQEEFKNFIDDIGQSVKNVTTVYPYIYHKVSVEELKKVIIERGWQPPTGKNIEEYISSGCRIMSDVIRELEKMEIITLNEREQAKAMVVAGLADEKEMEYANYDARKDKVNLNKALFDELEVKDYLKKICIDKGKEYE